MKLFNICMHTAQGGTANFTLYEKIGDKKNPELNRKYDVYNNLSYLNYTK